MKELEDLRITKPLNDKIIYECYKPQTLKESKDYAHYILNSRYILPNIIEGCDQDNISSEDIGKDLNSDNELIQIENQSLKKYMEKYMERAKSNV